MTCSTYHYTECGLSNIYLQNGFHFIETSRGKAVSIKDAEGLHKAIGLFLVTNKKDFTGEEVRFLRNEMLMSQLTLANLLGLSEQAIRRWENGKIDIPKPSESLIRLLYREHIHNQDGRISNILKKIAQLEESLYDMKIIFKETSKGWKAAA
jgi:putative transcriptional regulator